VRQQAVDAHEHGTFAGRPTIRSIQAEIFEVRSELIKWIEDKTIKVRKQAKLVIMNLGIASREPDPSHSSLIHLLAAQVEELRALAIEKRWQRR